jgi:hypothetical protein
MDLEEKPEQTPIGRPIGVGPPVLPPSYPDEVHGESIPVCALLEMPNRYRFHSTPGPASITLSDANDPRAGSEQALE